MNLRGVGCVVSLLALVGIIVVLFDRHWEISVPYTVSALKICKILLFFKKKTEAKFERDKKGSLEEQFT